jgi:hypothetical protein
LDYFDYSFEIRTGPAGRPWTRLTRVWDRSGSEQQPAWELARRNPADLGKPGWDSIYFFFICIEVKRHRWTSFSLHVFVISPFIFPLHVQTASNCPFLLIQAASLSFSQWLVVRYFLVCSQPFLTQRLVSVIKDVFPF